MLSFVESTGKIVGLKRARGDDNEIGWLNTGYCLLSRGG